MNEINRETVLVIQRRYDGAAPDAPEWVDASGNCWIREDNREHVERAVAEKTAEMRELFGHDNVRAVRRVTTTTEEEVEL